jgi:hypothetical protein
MMKTRYAFRKIFPLLLLVALGGCLHPSADKRPVPSVVPLQASLARTDVSARRIQGASLNVKAKADQARSIADRIDAKATVLLQSWP